MNNAELNKVIDEINEVLEGRRGWVSLTKSRAAQIGIGHDLLLACARVHQLKTEPHGRHGWSATLAA